MIGKSSTRRPLGLLLSTAAAIPFVGSLALANPPVLCQSAAGWQSESSRGPAPVLQYLDSLGDQRFDLRTACARWAGTFSRRHQLAALNLEKEKAVAPRFNIFAARGLSQAKLVDWLKHTGHVRRIERARAFVSVAFSKYMPTARLREVLAAPEIEYAEPDCDGPDFLTTSRELEEPASPQLSCWKKSARASVPHDPCMDELWGHRKIGWDSGVAARSVPRMVAVLDSGIDALHQDLEFNVVLRMNPHEPPRSQGSELNARCATSGRCYPHGTEMAGTIGGRMNNGV